MTYLITNDNRVHRMPADGPEPANTALVFCTAGELMAGTTHWPLARLALVWNKLPGRKPVARFENRRIAVDRLWRAVQHIGQQLAGKATRSRKQSTGARQNRAELISACCASRTVQRCMSLWPRPHGRRTACVGSLAARCPATSGFRCGPFAATANAYTLSRSPKPVAAIFSLRTHQRVSFHI
jgi:hypothetical protein